MTPKAWYTSKVVWVNFLTMLALMLEIFTVANNSALLPPALVPWIAVAIAFVNIVLRVWFTTEPTTKPLGIGSGSNSEKPAG